MFGQRVADLEIKKMVGESLSPDDAL